MRESVRDLSGKGDEDVRREEALPAAPAGRQPSVSAPWTEVPFLLALACGPRQELALGGIISPTFSADCSATGGLGGSWCEKLWSLGTLKKILVAEAVARH